MSLNLSLNFKITINTPEKLICIPVTGKIQRCDQKLTWKVILSIASIITKQTIYDILVWRYVSSSTITVNDEAGMEQQLP
jgi:hypothetical protein